ncbi:MAG: glycosyltransferase [Bacteroidales bacterium]|nr:glycosyltransferase [Bacteroidales bacterium]MBN2755870.1 glycosyltransferase [Bacteroidales bacterium]
MLSICIPIFNCDVSILVNKLIYLLDNQNIKYEIILIDDCSDDKFKKTNSVLNNYKSVKYIQLETNIGRSKIRNHFLNFALFENLLFLDCDSQIADEKFIFQYLIEIKNNKKVICGGRTYLNSKPGSNKFLRWNYGMKRECKSAEIRKKNPYKSFLTNNFIVKKSILNQIKFNEELSTYGHEDTLFGYELKNLNIEISHIQNPVNHLFTETNKEFLEKTAQGIKNLAYIEKQLNDENFSEEVKILKTYLKVKKYNLQIPLFLILSIINPFIYFILKNTGRNLLFFDIYKIYLLIKEKLIYDKKLFKIINQPKAQI